MIRMTVNTNSLPTICGLVFLFTTCQISNFLKEENYFAVCFSFYLHNIDLYNEYIIHSYLNVWIKYIKALTKFNCVKRWKILKQYHAPQEKYEKNIVTVPNTWFSFIYLFLQG